MGFAKSLLSIQTDHEGFIFVRYERGEHRGGERDASTNWKRNKLARELAAKQCNLSELIEQKHNKDSMD